MSLFWDARYIWFNTVIFYCISGNHRHVFSRGISHPASFKLLLLIFLQCEKEYGLRIRISDWSAHGDTRHTRQCIPGMHLVVRSHVLHTPVYQKCKQNLSKMLVLNISFYKCCFHVSHFVSLCKKAFSYVHNMTPIFPLGDVLDTLSSM